MDSNKHWGKINVYPSQTITEKLEEKMFLTQLILWHQYNSDIKIRKGQHKNLQPVSVINVDAKLLFKILTDKIQKKIFKEPYGMIKWILSQGIQESSLFLSQ